MQCNGACHVRKNMAEEVGQAEQTTVPRLPLVEVEEVNFVVAGGISMADQKEIPASPEFRDAAWVYIEPIFEIPVPPPWQS